MSPTRVARPALTPAPPCLVSVREAARLLAVSRATIYRMLLERQLRSVRVRGRRLIAMASINRIAQRAG
jgi:excisionase family DNA binding protein